MDTIKKTFHILLADDDADDREFFSEALSEIKGDSIVTMFRDGKELMDYLERSDNPEPHILFLDLNMPCKTGIDCLKEIRSKREFDNLSIAIYSTSSSERDIEETFNSGANIYIKKPNDFGKLKKVIHDVVSLNWKVQTDALNMENFVFSA